MYLDPPRDYTIYIIVKLFRGLSTCAHDEYANSNYVIEGK